MEHSAFASWNKLSSLSKGLQCRSLELDYVGKSLMENRAQSLGTSRIISSSIQMPDMRLIQWTKFAFLCSKVDNVFVLSIYHSERTLSKGLEDAVLCHILRKRQTFVFNRRIGFHPRHQGATAHPARLDQTRQLENRRRD